MISARVLIAAGAALAFAAVAMAVAFPLEAAAIGLALLVVVPVILFAMNGRRIHPLEPLWSFLLCYAITFVLKPILDARGFATYTWFQFDANAAIRSIFVAACALLILYVGYFSNAYQAVAGFFPDVRRDPTPWRGRAVAAILMIGCVVAVGRMLSLAGVDLSFAEASAGRYRAAVLETVYGRGYLTLLLTFGVFAPPIQAFVALTTRRIGDAAAALAWTVVIFVAFTIVYSRQLTLQLVVLMLVVCHFRGGWLRPSAIVGVGVALLFIGGFLGLRLRANVDPLSAFAFLGHTFDAFEFLASSLDRLSVLGHLAGQSLVEDVAFTFLPRGLFPLKPDVFGIVRVQSLVAPALDVYSVRTATYPPGFIVEWYANFGAAGVVVIASAYGVLLRAAREWLWPRRHRLFPLLVIGGLVLNLTAMFRSSGQYCLQLVAFGGVLFALLYVHIPEASFRVAIGGTAGRQPIPPSTP